MTLIAERPEASWPNASELLGTIAGLRAENATLRSIISASAAELGNAAMAGPGNSMKLLATLPEEIRAEIDRLRKALEPLAAMYGPWMIACGDDTKAGLFSELVVGDLRRAITALTRPPGGGAP